MVKKFFAFAGLTVLTGVFAASAMAGCSSSDSSSNNTPNGNGDASDADRVRPEPDGDADVTSCYDFSAALGTKFTKIPSKNVCTAAKLDEFMSSCLSSTGTADTCKAFADANADCTACILGSKDATEYPVLLSTEQSTYVTIYACMAGQLDKPECVPVIQESMFCAQTACSTCGDTDRTKCINEALSDEAGCGQIATQECFDAFNAAYKDDAAFDASPCVKGAQDFEGITKAIAEVYCVNGTGGGGTTDAGTDAQP